MKDLRWILSSGGVLIPSPQARTPESKNPIQRRAQNRFGRSSPWKGPKPRAYQPSEETDSHARMSEKYYDLRLEEGMGMLDEGEVPLIRKDAIK